MYHSEKDIFHIAITNIMSKSNNYFYECLGAIKPVGKYKLNRNKLGKALECAKFLISI